MEKGLRHVFVWVLTGMAAVVVIGFLTGCGLTPQGTAIRQAVQAKGAEVMDQGLENAEWFMCYAASIGSVRRHYGKPGLADAYRQLCEGSAAGLIAPEPGTPPEAAARRQEGRNGESDEDR